MNNHLFGYQVNEDDFEQVDANNDGYLSTDEVFDAFKAMINGRKQVPTKIFSSNGNLTI